MNFNFNGNTNQGSQFSGFPGQHFSGGQQFPQQGFQSQQQPEMIASYHQMQGNQQGFVPFPGPVQGNMPQQQMYMQQQQQFMQYPQQQQQHFNPQQYHQQQQQHQKMLEKQQKLAQEQHRKEMEMRKKKDFEIQQKRLQQMGGFQRPSAKKSGDLTHLIGSLAKLGSDKTQTSKHHVATPTGRSFFARPGTQYPPPPETSPPKDQSLSQLSGLTEPATAMPGMALPVGSNSGFINQSNNEDDFSDFQEAPISFSSQSNDIQSTSWSLQTTSMSGLGSSWQGQGGGVPSRGVSGHGNTVISQIAQPYPPHTPNEPIQRDRADSQSSTSSIPGIHSALPYQEHQQIPNQFIPMEGRQGLPFVNPNPGTQQIVADNMMEPSMIPGQQLPGQHVVSGLMNVPGNGSHLNIEEKEESEEERLQRLYGITIPDWSKQDISLPGVYKDVKDAVTKNGAIDTSSLYPILLASELPKDILGQIWSRVNKATPGQLNDVELRMVLGLVALGQTGLKVERLTLEKLSTCKSAPIPTIPDKVLKPVAGTWTFQQEPQQEDPKIESSINPSRSLPYSEESSTNIKSEESKTDEGVGRLSGWSVSLSTSETLGTRISSLSSSETLGTHISSQLSGFSTSLANTKPIQNLDPVLSEVSTKPIISTSPDFQDFQSAIEVEDDFGDFHGPASDFEPPETSMASGIMPSIPSSSESFQNHQNISTLTSSEPENVNNILYSAGKKEEKGVQDVPQFPAISKPPGATEQNTFKLNDNWGTFPVASETKSEENNISFGNFSSLTSGSQIDDNGKDGKERKTELISQEKPSDKYDLLRDIDHEPSSIFSMPQQARKKDDSFGDFEGFQMAEANQEGFSDFQSNDTNLKQQEHKSDPSSSDNWNAFPSPSTEQSPLSFSQLTSATKTIKSREFGDFSQPVSMEKKEGFSSQSQEKPSHVFQSNPQSASMSQQDQFGDFSLPVSTENNSGFFSSSQGKDFSQGNTNLTSLSQDNFGDFSQSVSTENNSEFLTKNDENGLNFASFSTPTTSDNDFGDFSKSHFPTKNTPVTSESKANVASFGQFNSVLTASKDDDEFGDFSKSNSTASTINSTESSKGDIADSSKSLSNFTSGVPLDTAQRYRQLRGEEEDDDQHANVWGRCLNSCLLTLTTCAVAVQTMSEVTIKQEILQSRKGSDYFKAIIEVYRVTKRIQASLIKTDFFNQKLKDIMAEISQTWKNIANFLVETNLEEQCIIKDNFATLHVQSDEDKMLACGVCLLNVTKATDSKIAYGGRDYHSACANFWCNRVDSILPSLWPVNSLI